MKHVTGLLLTLLLAGCGLFRGWEDDGPTESVEITNDTSRDLYVTALTEDVLAVALLASEIRRDQMDRPPLEPGASMHIPFDDIHSDLARGKTVVFVIYAASPDDDVFHIARTLHIAFAELEQQGFRVSVSDGELDYPHLFGDPYWVLTEEDYAPEAYPPRIVGDELHLWVAFSGCSEGTFALAHTVTQNGIALSMYHDYPQGPIDCERMNVKELEFELPDVALGGPRVVLLNPNRGADPYADAFILSP